jgi:hypothetical protein
MRDREITLKATNARQARSEVASRFGQGANLYGYIKDECVYMTLVRERGNKAYVATATKGRKANRFTCVPLQ